MGYAMSTAHVLAVKLLAVLIALLGLLGCATAPAPAAPTTRTVLGCAAAYDLPTPPARAIYTDPAQPGLVVRQAVLNRAAWIAHADDLTTRITACK